MPLILGTNSIKDTGYNVDNSCRFEAGDDPYFSRTLGTATNRKKFTISVWVKLGSLVTGDNNEKTIFAAGSDYSGFHLDGNSDPALAFNIDNSDGFSLVTTQMLRDMSAWYHLVAAVDTTQGTEANRVKFYINGSQVSNFDTSNYPDQNYEPDINSGVEHRIGKHTTTSGTRQWDGYMAEFVFIDGTQYAASDFGEFNEDSPTIWQPKDVSGLTFGTNGYYLDFEDSSNLGNDANGGTDFTVTNLAAADQSTDTPTNNFCVMNPLDNYYANATLSEGNLKMVSGSSRECSSTATIALSNGKWFWEYEVTTMSAPFGGIQPIPSFGNTASAAVLQTNGLGYLKTGKVETTDGSGGSTELASYATYAANDIIGVALDLDAATNIIYFYKNGALQGSGVNLTHVDSTANGHYLIAFGAISGQDTFEINFGNPITALDSANADANGYGAFEYAVPSGFFSICTKNLAEYG